jgi:hypothetical protein
MSHTARADHQQAISIRSAYNIAGGEKDSTRNSLQRLRIRHQQELVYEAEMDIADGITPLDLDGVHSRVHAAKTTLTDDNRGGGALQCLSGRVIVAGPLTRLSGAVRGCLVV